MNMRIAVPMHFNNPEITDFHLIFSFQIDPETMEKLGRPTVDVFPSVMKRNRTVKCKGQEIPITIPWQRKKPYP